MDIKLENAIVTLDLTDNDTDPDTTDDLAIHSLDTAGTLVKSAEALLERGARSVYASAVHPVFSGPAIERISASSLQKVMVTDTLSLGEDAMASPKIEQLSLAVLLGEAIRRIHEGASVSSLFV